MSRRKQTIQVILLILSATVPWYVCDRILIQFDHRQGVQQELWQNLAKSPDEAFALVGDCTVSPFYIFTRELDDRHHKLADMFDDVRIFGFGGSDVQEWYYFTKRYHARLTSTRKLVFASPHARRFFLWPDTYTSRLPLFMTWADLYQYVVVEKRVSQADGLRFVMAKLFPSYMSSQDYRFIIYGSLFPQFASWQQQISQFRRSQTPAFQCQMRGDCPDHLKPRVYDRREYLQKIKALAKVQQIDVAFLLMPRASSEIDQLFLDEKAEFLAYCAELQLECVSESTALPDRKFNIGSGDGLHIVGVENLRQYLRRIRDKLFSEPQYNRRQTNLVVTPSH